MQAWDEFSVSAPEPFQLAVHDLGNMFVRYTTLPRVLELTTPDGLVVLDDMHHPKYGAMVPEVCQRARRKLLSVRLVTLDGYGRFAAVAVPR
jgi:predicted O-methyltransferase YrrM